MTLIEIGPDVVSCTPPVVTLPCSATVWLADRVAAIWAPVPVQVSGAPENVPGEQLAQAVDCAPSRISAVTPAELKSRSRLTRGKECA